MGPSPSSIIGFLLISGQAVILIHRRKKTTS
uniref:PEP-CTERM sorting domain-containing protein n=1 Tax=Fervidicoccus fontis TaxID=683846 RepID=A0A7J3SKC7_9CREN